MLNEASRMKRNDSNCLTKSTNATAVFPPSSKLSRTRRDSLKKGAQTRRFKLSLEDAEGCEKTALLLQEKVSVDAHGLGLTLLPGGRGERERGKHSKGK